MRLAGSLWRFWWMLGHLNEGRSWLAAALEREQHFRTTVQGAGSGDAWRSARAKVLRGAGVLAWDQSDYDTARMLLEESLVLARELGERPGIANSLNNLGLVAQYQGDLDTARALHEESLAIRREIGE